MIKSFLIPRVNKIDYLEYITILHNNWLENSLEVDGEFFYEYHYQIPDQSEKNLVLTIENYLYSVQVFLEHQEIYFYEDIYRERGINLL